MGNLLCLSCKAGQEKETGSLTGIDALPGKKRKLPCGLELYDVLRSYRVQEEDDSGLDDIEKAAKAIVSMSLFITTKIIYPAYIRYLKEDHPETYTQYFDRPECPVPPIDYDRTDLKSRSVRFLTAPETIPEDAEEDVDWSWYYTDDSQFDADDEADEYSDTYLAAKDSLTLIRGYSDHGEELASLIDILRKILDALTKGVLTSEQVRALGLLAREIVAGLPGSREDLAVQPSGSSLFADDVARQALVKVKKELLVDVELDEKLKREQEAKDDVRLQPESVTTLLADMIGTRALCLAVEHLQYRNLMQEPGRVHFAPISTLSLQKRRQPSPTGINTYITSALDKAADEIQKELHASVDVSETAVVLQQSLADALQDIKASARPGETTLTSDEEKMVPLSRDTSRTCMLVKNTLTHVIHDLYKDGSLSKQLKKSSPSEVFSEGLVQIALEQCIEEVKSDLKSFDDLLQLTSAIIQSHQKSQKPLGPKAKSPDHILSAKVSSTVSESSAMVDKLIRDTLGIAKKAIGEGELQPMAVQGVAKDLWGPSLQHYETILHDITKEAFGYPDDITKSSSTRLAEKSVVDALKSVLPEQVNLYRMEKLTSSTFCIAESSVEQAFKTEFSDMEIKDYPKSPFTTQQVKSTSSTSVVAEELVNRAFQELVDEYKKSKSEDFEHPATGRLLKTYSSDLATKCVELAITDVLNDLDSSTYQYDLVQPEEKNSSKELLLLLSKALEGVVSGVLKESPQESVPTSSNYKGENNEVKDENGLDVKPVHVIINDNNEFEDESSHEELSIHPVLDDEELPIDHHLIENALEILSVKKDEDLGHTGEPAARQSFQNIFRPNVKRVHRLDLGNKAAICKELLTLSHFETDNKPNELDPSAKDRRWSMPPTLSSLPHPFMPNMIEEEDDDEEIISITNLHTMKPDKKERKSFPVAKAKSLPKTDNRHKKTQPANNQSTSIKRSKHKEIQHRKSSETGANVAKQSSSKSSKPDSIQQTQSTNKRSQASLHLKSSSTIRQAKVVSSLPQVNSKHTSDTKGRVRSESTKFDKEPSPGSTPGTSSKTTSRNKLDFKRSPRQNSFVQSHVKKTEKNQANSSAENTRTSAISGMSPSNISNAKTNPGSSRSQEKYLPQKCESAGPTNIFRKRSSSKVSNECVKDVAVEGYTETSGSEAPATLASTEIDTSNVSRITDADDVAEIITEEEPIIQKSMRKKSYRRSSTEFVTGKKSSSSKDSLKIQKKASNTSSGIIREFTSNTIHPQSTKSIASSISSEGKGRSSHQTVSLTPRPSSGYRKSPTPRSLGHLPGCSNSQLTGAKSNTSGKPVTHNHSIQAGFDSQEQTQTYDTVDDMEKPTSVLQTVSTDPTNYVVNSVSEKNPTATDGSSTSLKTLDRDVELTPKLSMSSLTVANKPATKNSASATVEKSDSKITCTHSETLSVHEETNSESGRIGKPSTESLPGLSTRNSQYKVSSRRSSAITKKD